MIFCRIALALFVLPFILSACEQDDFYGYKDGIDIYFFNDSPNDLKIHFANAAGIGETVICNRSKRIPIPMDMNSDSMSYHIFNDTLSSKLALKYELEVKHTKRDGFYMVFKSLISSTDTFTNNHKFYGNNYYYYSQDAELSGYDTLDHYYYPNNIITIK